MITLEAARKQQNDMILSVEERNIAAAIVNAYEAIERTEQLLAQQREHLEKLHTAMLMVGGFTKE